MGGFCSYKLSSCVIMSFYLLLRSYDDTKDISEVSMHSPPPSPVKAAGELEQEERSSECDSQVYVVQGTVSFS